MALKALLSILSCLSYPGNYARTHRGEVRRYLVAQLRPNGGPPKAGQELRAAGSARAACTFWPFAVLMLITEGP